MKHLKNIRQLILLIALPILLLAHLDVVEADPAEKHPTRPGDGSPEAESAREKLAAALESLGVGKPGRAFLCGT